MTTTPDFRALCAELLSALETEGYAHWALDPDEDPLVKRARIALATPPPEPPTDEELDELSWNWYSKTGSTWWQIDSYRAFARAALERWEK
jgi:hypothetical protein